MKTQRENVKKRMVIICLILAMIGMAFSATPEIKKKKLQVFLLLGQSNMVGLADVSTFQYLLQDPFMPSFEVAKPALSYEVFYANVFSKFGFELEREVKLLGDFWRDTLRMKKQIQDTEDSAEPGKPRRKGGEVRPMTTDERASAVIVSLYMALFCICTFIFWY